MTSLVADITFDADTHTYWYGMENVPSVSEILRPITEKYLDTIPESILNWKRDLGIAVHKACELFDLGTLDEASLDERIVPYLEGYKRFMLDKLPTWHDIESIVFEETARYAGTLDRAGSVDGHFSIVDIKTSVSIQPSAAVQLWAYALAHDEMVAPSLYVLQLTGKGDYVLKEFTDYDLYSETWDALLALRRWNKLMEKSK